MAELVNCREELGAPNLGSLVTHIGLVGAGNSSELTDSVVLGQTQGSIHFQLSLAKPVEPDVVVTTLHHGLRFHHVLHGGVQRTKNISSWSILRACQLHLDRIMDILSD